MGRIGKSKTKSKPSDQEQQQQLKYVGPKDVPAASLNFHSAAIVLALFFAVDAVVCLLLFGSIHRSPSPPPLPSPWSLLSLLSSITNFTHDSLDLLLLTLLRITLLSSLSWVASRYAFMEGWDMEVVKARGKCTGKGCTKKGKGCGGASAAAAAAPSAATTAAEALAEHKPRGPFSWLRDRFKNEERDRARALATGGLSQPLLDGRQPSTSEQDSQRPQQQQQEQQQNTEGAPPPATNESPPGVGVGGRCCCQEEEEGKEEVIVADKEEPDPGFKEWLLTVSAKDATLLVSFLVCTFFQVYVGAKCVSFFFTDEALQGLLMGSAVVWINLESYAMSSAAESSGVLGRATALLELRSQGLNQARLGAASRGSEDLEQGTSGGKDAASSAPALRDAAFSSGLSEHTAEDVLRGDRGIKKELVVSPGTYLMRSIALAYAELPLLSCGFLCLAVTSTAGLIIPNYQGKILDDVIRMDISLFRRDVFLMAMLSVVTGIFGGIRGLCFSVVGKRILKTLQDKLFQGVILQDIAYFDSTTSGELTSRLTNDVAAMSEPINWQLSALVRNLAQLGGGIALCFWTSWKLSMLAFTTMQPIMHITSIYSRWSRDLNRSRYAVLAEANSAASEAFSNIRTVRAYSTEDVEVDRYRSKTKAAMLKGVRDAVAYSGAVAINNWLDLGASVLILWYGGYLVMAGRLSIGQLITFQLYWNLIQNGYQSVMSVLTSLTKASGAAQRVLSLVDALPDIDPNSGIKVTNLLGSVAFNDVQFHYQMRPDNQVLRGVSLSIAPGQVCALVGRSGGGKSTLVHLLMRYYDPISGTITLDGQDLRRLNLKSVHSNMGLVAQETQMWATSIEENIAYGLPKYTRAEVEEAAKFANAHQFIMEFPEGYATRVGERGVRLSGGQRQRIAIARMLLRKPRLLVLDEATSALDTESEALVQSALDRLIGEGGRTIILVAHRLSTVRNADIIGVIDNGRIVEQGTHESLVKMKNGVYEKLVRRQLSKSRNVIGGVVESATGGKDNDRIDQLLEAPEDIKVDQLET